MNIFNAIILNTVSDAPDVITNVDGNEVSNVIACIAIIVSIIAAIYSYKVTIKLNKINSNAQFNKDIFWEYLKKEIPLAREYISFNQGEIRGVQKLSDLTNEIRRAAIFYKYSDKEFYENLHKELQTLEDHLIKDSEGIFTSDEFVEFHSKTEKFIEAIYKIIMNNYEGME